MGAQNKKIENIIKSCKGLNLLATLGYLLLMIAFFGGIFEIIRTTLLPEGVFSIYETKMGMHIDNSINGPSFASIISFWEIPGSVLGVSYSFKSLQLTHLIMTISLIVGPTGIVMYGLSKILDNITLSQSPFISENIEWMKRIGWILLLQGIFTKIIWKVVFSIFVFKGNHFGNILEGIDFGSIFAGGILLIFANVFDYGMYLQQEYDETL